MESMTVRVDEYGRLEVSLDKEGQKDLWRQIRYVENLDNLDSEWGWIPLQRRWAESVCDEMSRQLGRFGLIVVNPEEVMALTDEANTLIVDTGLPPGEDDPEDMWVEHPWGWNVLADKYSKRMWYDDSYAIRSWLETLARNGVFKFSLNHDDDKESG